MRIMFKTKNLLDKLAHKEELIAKFEIDNKELAHALKFAIMKH